MSNSVHCERIEELEEEQLYSSNDPSGHNTERHAKGDTPQASPLPPTNDTRQAWENGFLKMDQEVVDQVDDLDLPGRLSTDKKPRTDSLPSTNRYLNDSICQLEDPGSCRNDTARSNGPLRFPTEEGALATKHPEKEPLKAPRSGSDLHSKTNSMENRPKMGLHMFNLCGGKSLHRKRSHDLMAEFNEANKTALSLKEKRSESEQSTLPADSKQPNLYAADYRPLCKRPPAYQYKLPPTLFQSMVANKRANFSADYTHLDRPKRTGSPRQKILVTKLLESKKNSVHSHFGRFSLSKKKPNG